MAANQANDARYTKEEMLVIAMDLGTTNRELASLKVILYFDGSTPGAVSYSHLYPGEVPTVQMVSKWSGQPEASGDAKIPSVIAYKLGQPVAYGVEALELEADAEYEIAKWFKLHLHPESMKTMDEPPAYGTDYSPGMEIPPLPRNVTLKRVYADLMKYLYQGTRTTFQAATPNGLRIWQRLQNRIVIVLCTPNAWDISQQDFLRRAAIEAGIIKGAQAATQVEFVTEGEASVHYALKYTQGSIWLKKGSMFAVTDAGGSTVDSTLYECKEAKPRIILEEVCGSECVQAGGVFVDRAIQEVLREKLESSRFSDEEMLTLMVKEFERKTKRVFDGSQTSNVISFGRTSDNDRAHGIVKGKLSLSKAEVASSFKTSVDGIIDSGLKLLRGHKILHLLLVGGFGESPYLQKSLNEHLSSHGAQIVTVSEPAKKAASEGALLWYIRQLVVARAARFTIGTGLQRLFDPTSPLHQARVHRAVVGVNGRLMIRDFFEPLLKKDSVVPQDMQQFFKYHQEYATFPTDELEEFEITIASWEGLGETEWFVDERGYQLPQMRNTCTLRADLSRLAPTLTQQIGINGYKYWSVGFEIALKLGRTQLEARLQWKEGNKTRRGPVTIIPGSLF